MKRIILFVLCFILGSLALTGCSIDSEPFKGKIYTSDSQINEIRLDVRDREIEVSLSEDEQVHIQYAENNKEYYDISISNENVLTMTSTGDKDWTDYIGVKPSSEDRKISLQIPDVLLKKLTLYTTNEDITLSALTVTESISISSNGGNIAFENLDAGRDIFLKAKNGDISGTIAGSYENFAIQTEIKKGDSNLPGNKTAGEKVLSISGNNGDITIDFRETEQ